MALPTNASWDVGTGPTSTYLNARMRDTIQFLRNRPHAILEKNNIQSATSGTLIQIIWNLEVVDTDNGHSNTTNPTRYVVQTPGIYWLNAVVAYVGNIAGMREVWFRVNGTTAYRYGWQSHIPGSSGSTTPTFLSANAHIRLETNQYVEVTTLQQTGSAVTLNATGARFEILWVSK